MVERMISARGRRPAGHRHRRARSRCSARPTPCTSTRRSSSTRSGSPARPATSPRSGLPDLARYITFGASPRALDQHGPGRRRRSPSSAAATTRCPTTSATSPGTCCATGSCCPTRRSPTTSAPTTCSARRRRRRGAGAATCALRRTPVPTRPRPARPHPRALLRRLEWRVMRRLDGRLQGDYRTLFRGTGVDFADLREYTPGDDLRHIDWNVTARLDTPYVREYIEDREVTAWLLLDRSASMGFGPVATPARTSVLAEIAVALAQVLSHGGNRVGALRVRRRLRRRSRRAQGRNQVLRITQRAAGRAAPPERPGTTDLASLLRAALGIARRRSPRRHRLRLHQPHRAGSGRWRCWPDATTWSRSRSSTRGSPSSRRGDGLRRGRRDRRADLRRHQRPGVPRAAGAAADERQETLVADRRVGPAPRPHPVATDEDLVRALVAHLRAAQTAATMSFEWPLMLLALARRRRCSWSRTAASCAARGRAGPSWPPSGWSPPAAPGRTGARHVAPVAVARRADAAARRRWPGPAATVAEPRREGTVILAFDVSTSMAAKDLHPTRLEAAKAAARTFVERQPSTVRSGVVAFGGTGAHHAAADQRPGAGAGGDRPARPQGGTALGRGDRCGARAPSRASRCSVDETEPGRREPQGRPRLLRLGRDRAALRRREHHRARTRSRWPSSPRPPACGSTRSGWAAPRARSWRSTASRSRRARRGRCSSRSPTTTDGTYYAAQRRRRAGSKVYSSIDLAWTARTEHVEITAWFAAAAAVLLLLGRRLSRSCVRAGGLADVVRLAARPARRCSPCPLLRRGIPLAAAAAPPARRSGSRASR